MVNRDFFNARPLSTDFDKKMRYDFSCNNSYGPDNATLIEHTLHTTTDRTTTPSAIGILFNVNGNTHLQ